MSGTKDIKVIVRFRNTLNVGTSGDYDILADAINAAQDGDIILVAPGEYTAASQFPTYDKYDCPGWKEDHDFRFQSQRRYNSSGDGFP